MNDNLKKVARASISGALSNVPIVGGVIDSFIHEYLPNSLKTRRDKILEKIGCELETLLEDNFTLEKSLKEEENVSLLLKMLKILEIESSEQKINHIRNIYINSLFDNSLDSDKKQIFMNLASELTVRHFHVLKIMNNPSKALEEKNKTLNLYAGGVESLFEVVIDDYTNNKDFYRIIYKDLVAKFLLAGDLGGTMSASGIISSRTTDLGKLFVKYLSSPVITMDN